MKDDVEFKKHFSNAYRALIIRARNLEIQVKSLERQRQMQKFFDEYNQIKNSEKKLVFLDEQLHKAQTLGQKTGDVKKLMKKLLEKKKYK